jgi:hypothetical protein
MKSRLLSSSASKSVSFRGPDLLSVSSIEVETKSGDTVEHGAVSLHSGGKEKVLHKSREVGFVAVAVLANGQIAVARSDDGIAILSPGGAIVRELDTELGAPADWLAVGGIPERLFAATTASGSKKTSDTVAELDVETWERRHVPLRSTRLPGISEHGVCRVTRDGRIAQYAWKGAPKPMTPGLVDRGSWRSVRVRDGWLLYSPWSPNMYVDLTGHELWNRSILASFPGGTADDHVQSACAAGANRLVLVTRRAIYLVDGPSGALLDACERAVRMTDDHQDGNVVWDGGARLAVSSDAGVEIVEGLPPLAITDGAPVAGAAATKEAPKGAATKKAAKPAKAGAAVVDALVLLVEELAAVEDPKKLARIHKKIAALDLLEASDDPACAKRVGQAVRKVRALAKATKAAAARVELEHILDTMTAS